MKRNKKRKVFFTIILVVIACLVVGYAVLSTTLNINGTSSVKGNTWDVHFANIHITDGSTTGNTKEATITNPTLVEFNINLDKPGDYYEFTVDVVNAGTIDAMLDVVSNQVLNSSNSVIELPDYLIYSITYSDDNPIEQNHLLMSNTTDTYKVRVEYNRDIDNSDLVTTDTSIKFRVSTTFTQADDTGIPRFIYAFNTDQTELGEPMGNINNGYYTYQESIQQNNFFAFIRHTISEGVIYDSELGFEYNNNVYYLDRGVYDEGVNNSNLQLLFSVFGEENCPVEGLYRHCSDGTKAVNTYRNHLVSAEEGLGKACAVLPIGSSYCYISD